MPNGDESQREAGAVNLETHPLVDKLHPNPDEIADIVALVGYIGPSRKEGYVRLYSDLTFRNYYEVPTSGILVTAPTDAGNENSPTSVHVSADTLLEAVSISSQSVEARYLQGSISSSHLGSAGAGAQTVGTFPTITQINCGPAQTIGCHPAGAGVQAVNVGTGVTMYNTCWTCGASCWTCGQTCFSTGIFTTCPQMCFGAEAQAAQAVGTGPTVTQINCGPAQTIGCHPAGAQAANAGIGVAMGNTFAATCFTCGQTCWSCGGYTNCLNNCAAMGGNVAGAQAGHPAAQAVGTIPSLLTRINCGAAQTIGCCLGAGAQAVNVGTGYTIGCASWWHCQVAQAVRPPGPGINAPNYFTETCFCTLIGGPCP